jgi:hypothetical protein
MNTFQVKVEGTNLVITIPMQQPTPSASGKTLVVASTHGNQVTSTLVNGKAVTLGLNAYIRA